MNKSKSIIEKINPVDKINGKYRKDKLDRSFKLIAIEKGKLNEVAEIRVYFPGNTAYACFWCHRLNMSGSGKASGYGYSLSGAAQVQALHNAGIEFSRKEGVHPEGFGDNAGESALEALAEALKLKKYKVIVTYP